MAYTPKRRRFSSRQLFLGVATVGSLLLGGAALALDHWYQGELTPERACRAFNDRWIFVGDVYTTLPDGRLAFGNCECDIANRTWTSTQVHYGVGRAEDGQVFIKLRPCVGDDGPPIHFPHHEYRFTGRFERPLFGQWQAVITDFIQVRQVD